MSTTAIIQIVILGGPNSGSLVAQCINDLAPGKYALAGMLNDYLSVGESVCGTEVLGPFESWPELPDGTRFIGAVHKAGKMDEYGRRMDELGIPAERWISVVHPTAAISGDAVVEEGVYVGPHVAVMPRAHIGAHTSLRAGCYVSHGVALGRHCFVGPNAVVNGEAVLETGAFVGPGAVVRDGLRVGAFATVAPGAVALRDVPARATVIGNPARRTP